MPAIKNVRPKCQGEVEELACRCRTWRFDAAVVRGDHGGKQRDIAQTRAAWRRHKKIRLVSRADFSIHGFSGGKRRVD
jgi:hypothetical protein